MIETLIIFGVFLSVVMLTFVTFGAVNRRREISKNVEAVQFRSERAKQMLSERYLKTGNVYITHYFNVLNERNPQSLKYRLIRAGFFSPNALTYFNILRGLAVFGLFIAIFIGLTYMFPAVGTGRVLPMALISSSVGLILANAVLDRMGTNKQTAYRKIFPDFMDLLIVCVDAGLSIEMALDRVTREFMVTNPDFGVHLGIITLEVRAGRPLHEALVHFSERVGIEEARSLATLFRQSEELGASVTQTLRVFASEMRERRIIRAEEKANQLPVKMLFPMALFLFPVSLVIVLVPILMTIIQMFRTIGPNF